MAGADPTAEYLYYSWKTGGNVAGHSVTTTESKFVTISEYERKNFHQLQEIVVNTSGNDLGGEVPEVPILKGVCGKLNYKYTESSTSTRDETYRTEDRRKETTEETHQVKQTVTFDVQGNENVGYLLKCIDIKFADGTIIHFVVHDEVCCLNKGKALLILKRFRYDENFFLAVAGLLSDEEMDDKPTSNVRILEVNFPWQRPVPPKPSVLQRQTGIIDAGYPAGHHFYPSGLGPGWYDITTRGVPNDYCRMVGDINRDLRWCCAPAGGANEYAMNIAPLGFTVFEKPNFVTVQTNQGPKQKLVETDLAQFLRRFT